MLRPWIVRDGVDPDWFVCETSCLNGSRRLVPVEAHQLLPLGLWLGRAFSRRRACWCNARSWIQATLRL